jgi:hypothetical protein
MNEIATVTLAIIVISSMTIILGIIISKFHTGQYNNKSMDTPFCDDITNEEEIIMLLRNIAKNQRIIKTNTTVIAIIMLIPILLSIFILATGTSILSTLFN